MLYSPFIEQDVKNLKTFSVVIQVILYFEEPDGLQFVCRIMLIKECLFLVNPGL